MAKKMTSIEFDENKLKEYKSFAKEKDITFTTLVKLSLNEYIESHRNSNGKN